MVEDRVNLEKQVNFINTLKIDIQKLILSLGTGTLVFSISFLQIIPKSENKTTNNFLIWFWLLLIVSVISGILALVGGAMWYGHKLMIDNSKDGKYKTKCFHFKTKLWNKLAEIFDFMNVIFFTMAMILAVVFVIRVFNLD